MKYLLSFTLPLLAIAWFAFSAADTDSTETYGFVTETGQSLDLANFSSVSDLITDCEGEAVIGGSCEANCSGSCSCETGLFKCKCECEEVEEQTIEDGGHSSITPASDDSFARIKAIVALEDTETARKLLADITKLQELGSSNNMVAYDALADQLDEDVMKLQPATIEKIVVEFRS